MGFRLQLDLKFDLDFEPPRASAHLCTTRTTTGGEVAAQVEVRRHLKNHTTELAGLQRILHSPIAQAIIQRCSHSSLRAAWSSLTVQKTWISGYCLDGESGAGMELRFSILALRRVPWRDERETWAFRLR